MNPFKLLFIAIFLSHFLSGQHITSGIYDSGLKLAYDPSNGFVTGYFEQYTGIDEETGDPRFSCIFYLEGILKNDSASILTYFPQNKKDDGIIGTLITSSNEIFVHLPEDHGGCWNVQPFKDEPVNFNLETKTNWIQIRYVTVPKTFFFSAKDPAKKQKAYILKGDVVCIEKIEGNWAYCTYYGKKGNTKGWISLKDLNSLNS